MANDRVSALVRSVIALAVPLFMSVRAYGVSPRFDAAPYSVVVDVSPPGLQTFEIHGSASDADVGELVEIFYTGPSPWSQFASVPGNPATFTFGGAGLGYNDIGTYVFGLIAADDAPIQNFTQTIITVRIVPEPASLSIGSFVLLHPGVKRRRLRPREP